jgi:nicotinamidase-related amidase
LDAAKKGFNTCVVTDAVAAVNLKPDDGKIALDEMRRAGITLLDSSHIR